MLHLKLELVESQGELVCFCVDDRPDRIMGSGTEIGIGASDESLLILPSLGCARAISLGVRPDATGRALGVRGVATAGGAPGLRLALLVL